MNYLAALLLTLAVEVPLNAVALPALGALGALGAVDRREAARAGALANLASHPVAWLVAWPVLRWMLDPTPAFVVLELLVAAGEWAGLRRWRSFDGWLLAALVFAVNGVSMGIGAVLL